MIGFNTPKYKSETFFFVFGVVPLISGKMIQNPLISGEIAKMAKKCNMKRVLINLEQTVLLLILVLVLDLILY